MRKKLLFVYNPISGKGLIRQNLSNIIEVFTENDCDVFIHPTQSSDDASETVINYAEYVDMIVCGGGDGTLDEVVTGVMKSSRPDIPVGYIPCGSTNDFALSLGMAKDMVQAAKDIMVGDIYQCDVGQLNEDHIFIYVAAFGLFTDVSYETDQDLKNKFGHLAYLAEAGKRILNIPSIHMVIRADGQVIEGNYSYGMVTNSRSVGGMRNLTGPAVDMNDGLFEVTLVHTPVTPIELSNIAATLLAEDRQSPLIDTLKAAEITFETGDPIKWTLDGEYGGNHQKVVIRNLHKKLNLFLNRRNVQKKVPSAGLLQGKSLLP